MPDLREALEEKARKAVIGVLYDRIPSFVAHPSEHSWEEFADAVIEAARAALAAVPEGEVRCARDSDWCDGTVCRENGIECPNADAPPRGSLPEEPLKGRSMGEVIARAEEIEGELQSPRSDFVQGDAKEVHNDKSAKPDLPVEPSEEAMKAAATAAGKHAGRAFSDGSREAAAAVRAAYAIDSRSGGEGLHLSRDEAETLYRVLVEKPADSAAWAVIADRVYAFLADTEGSEDG